MEVARLACVHKAYLLTWRELRAEDPKVWEPPTQRNIDRIAPWPRLMRAAWLGDEAVVARLLVAGADEGDVGEFGNPDADSLRGKALDCAAQQGHEAVAAQLIAAGVENHAFDNYALISPAQHGYDAVVAQLLASGADVHAYDDAALRSASAAGHIEVVEVLLAAGANVHSLAAAVCLTERTRRSSRAAPCSGCKRECRRSSVRCG